MRNGNSRDKKRLADAYSLREVLAQVATQDSSPPLDVGDGSLRETRGVAPLVSASSVSNSAVPPGNLAVTPTRNDGSGSWARTANPPALNRFGSQLDVMFSGRKGIGHLDVVTQPEQGDHNAQPQRVGKLGGDVPQERRVRTMGLSPTRIGLIGIGAFAGAVLAWSVGLFASGNALGSKFRKLERAASALKAVTIQTVEVDLLTESREGELGLISNSAQLAQNTSPVHDGLAPSSAAVIPPAEAVQPVQRFVAPNIVATAGAADVPWPIEIDSASGPLTGSKIVIIGLPAAATLNHGMRGADGTWSLMPADLPGLKLALPAHASSARLTVVLSTSEGVEIARVDPALDVRPPIDPNSPFGKNDREEKAKDLLQQGEAHLSLGDITGARMFFQKAANAGDANAAIALGRSFEPDFLANLKVKGMTPDIEAARRWYRRAIDLGSKEAFDRLERLKPN